MSYTGNGTDAYLSLASALATTAPLAFSVWYRAAAATTCTLLSCSDVNSGDNHFYLGVFQTGSEIFPRFKVRATGETILDSGTAMALDVWHNIVAIARSATDRQMWLNGVSVGTSSVSRVPSAAAMDRTAIGKVVTSGATSFFVGELAEVAMWTGFTVGDFSAAVVAALAAKVRPRLILPASLVLYKSQAAGEAGVHDIGGTFAVNGNGSYSQANHPPIIYPPKQRRLQLMRAA